MCDESSVSANYASSGIYTEEVEFATLSWVDWFNNRRLFEPIGNVPPSEKEIEYYPKLQGSVLAA